MRGALDSAIFKPLQMAFLHQNCNHCGIKGFFVIYLFLFIFTNCSFGFSECFAGDLILCTHFLEPQLKLGGYQLKETQLIPSIALIGLPVFWLSCIGVSSTQHTFHRLEGRTTHTDRQVLLWIATQVKILSLVMFLVFWLKIYQQSQGHTDTAKPSGES